MPRIALRERVASFIAALLSLVLYADTPSTVCSLSPDGDKDMTARILSAVEDMRAAGGGTVRLSAGAYHFRSPTAMRFYVSTHNNPMPRTVFLPLTNLTDVVVAGRDVDFVFHGEGVGVMLQDCRRTSLRGIRIDYATPWFVETRFEAFDDGRPVVRCNSPQFSLAAEDGRLVTIGEGWKGRPRLFGVFDSDSGAFCGWKWTDGTATALGDGRFRIESDWRALGFASKMTPGDVVLVRDPLRPNPAVFVNRSVDTRLEDCAIHSSPGIGLLAQRSENVSVRGSGVPADRRAGSFAKSGYGCLTSLQADATHFSNCKGMITVENCLFEGMSDDAINVHSTCLQIESMPDARKIICRYRHEASVGFEVFMAGETLRFIKARTLEDVERTVKVKTALMTDADRVELSLDGDVPHGIGVGDAVENADWQPSVAFRGNLVRNCTARGALFTTPGRVVCEGNTFDHVALQPILLEGDASGWYESGGCRDVEIRRNVFRDCMYTSGKGLIQIAPSVQRMPEQRVRYHRNILIEDNEFVGHSAPLVFARGASNVVWRANSIENNDRRAGDGAHLFDIADCESVEIDDERHVSE